jgi:hypothetical protein
LAVWGAGPLERSRGVGQEQVAPLAVLRRADLMFSAQLADRPALQSLEHDQRLLLGLPLRRFMAVLPAADRHASLA